MIRIPGLPRPSSPTAVAALVLALSLLVAAASIGAPLRALIQGGHADRIRILVDLVPVFLLGAGVAFGFALFVRSGKRPRRAERIAEAQGLPGGDRADALSLRAALLRCVPSTAAAVALVSLLLIAASDFGPREARPGTQVFFQPEGRLSIPWSMSDWFGGLVLAGEGTGGPDRPMEVGTPGGGRLSFLQIGIGLLAALLGGAILWHWHRRRVRRDRVRDEEEDGYGKADRERARGALADMIRAMLADPDPNTAIRGAYARLLVGLDDRGRGRREHEGPMEHLHRVLTTLRVRPGPLRELIELFELARFSPHVLAGTHRDRALAALRAVAADLEAGPGGGP